MRERKKALQRLLAVKTQLRELERARLAEIERHKAKAQDDRDAMLRFLAGVGEKDPLLLSLACRRVVATERGAAALEAKADAQREIVLRRSAQKQGVERLLREAAAALEREEEKRRLLEIGERQASAPPTSLP
jgi:GNAT superfamily N-acetyltransferase